MTREERIAELKKHAIFLSLMSLRDGAGREMPYPPSHTLATAITETLAENERLRTALADMIHLYDTNDWYNDVVTDKARTVLAEKGDKPND